MSARAQALAEQFEQVNAETIAAVEACDDQAWNTASRAEGWPVAFSAWHIAEGHTTIMGLVAAVANGQQVPALTAAMLDAKNADDLSWQATCSKQEALDALRQNGMVVANAIRRLSDDQLGRSAVLELFGGAPMNVQQLIELVLVGHARQHLASIPVSVRAFRPVAHD